MIKIITKIVSIIAITLNYSICVGQNTLASSDDLSRIALTPVILSNAKIPSYATSLVKNKLIQVVTQNGLGGNALDQRFIITANITEVSKEIAPTAPVMITIDLQPILYIGDQKTGNLYSSCVLPMIKGVGTNDTKAYLSAIKNMNISTQEVIGFVESGKIKIIEYYNSQIDFILSYAESLANQEKYEEAIALLFTVPSVCKDAYTRAMDKTSVIYQMKIDKESAINFNKAKQVWNADQSYDGAVAASRYLSNIHPLSSSVDDAEKLSNNIAERIRQLDNRAWNFTIRKYEDFIQYKNNQLDYDREIKLKLIDAAKDVGVAQASRPITYNVTMLSWW